MSLQYVIRDKRAIGFILGAGPKGYRAFDEGGRPIGLFDSEELAARAVYEQADAARSSPGCAY
jgi:hypothetical protein